MNRDIDYTTIIGKKELNENSIFKLVDYISSMGFIGKLKGIDSEFLEKMNLVMGMLYNAEYYND